MEMAKSAPLQCDIIKTPREIIVKVEPIKEEDISEDRNSWVPSLPEGLKIPTPIIPSIVGQWSTFGNASDEIKSDLGRLFFTDLEETFSSPPSAPPSTEKTNHGPDKTSTSVETTPTRKSTRKLQIKEPSDGQAEPEQTPTKKIGKKKGSTELSQPLALDNLGLILRPDLRTRLNQNANKCVATNKNGNRCSIRRNIPATVATRLLDELALLDVHEDLSSIYKNLYELVDMVLCGSPHKRMAREYLALIVEDIELKKVQSKGTESVTSTATKKQLEALDSWVKSICGIATPNEDEPEAVHSPQQIPKESSQKKPLANVVVTYTPPVLRSQTLRVTSTTFKIPKYFPYDIGADRTIQEEIKRVAQRRLTSTGRLSGYIYMYWQRGVFGYAKIGYTTTSIEERANAWKKCGGELELRFSEENEEEEKEIMAHAFRVEQLIHAELKQLRYCQTGCQCGRKSHIEWFNVSEKHARMVQKKYQDWIKTEPYDSEGRLKVSLDSEEIKKLCTPLEIPVIKSTPERKKNTRRESGQRRFTRSSI